MEENNPLQKIRLLNDVATHTNAYNKCPLKK